MRADPGPVLILGAGPTGLGAAHRLHELGFRDFLVLERGGQPGGLASSVQDPLGFTWDLGGHVHFSHYAYYDRVLDDVLQGEWLWHERVSSIWTGGRFVPYPYQNNIHRLDVRDRDRVLAGLEHARALPAAAELDFRTWILSNFGAGMCELFLVPYNAKVWGYPPESLSSQWVGQRVAIPDLARIRDTIRLNRDDVSGGPNRRFRFPLRGGTGEIWRRVAARIPAERLRFHSAVEAVDLGARRVRLSDGSTLGYRHLLNTMPLDQLVARSGPLSREVQDAAGVLRHSSTLVVGVGLKGKEPERLSGVCWIYFPDANSPYHRVTVFSHYSPNHVPSVGHWSLMAEVCETPGRPVQYATLADQVLAALVEDRMIEDLSQVTHVWKTRLEYGYPTPVLNRDAALQRIQAELAQHGVTSRGRFGGWKYEVGNQDHSFMQGVEWVDAQMLGQAELTYPDPERANSGVVHSTT